MKFTVDNKTYFFKGVEERDGQEGITYVKYLSRDKTKYDEYFLPFSYISSVDYKCVEKFLSKYRNGLFIFIVITLIFTQPTTILFLIIPFLLFFAYLEYIEYFKVKMFINDGEGEYFLVFDFDDMHEACQFGKILKEHGIKGIMNSIKYNMAKSKKLFNIKNYIIIKDKKR